MKPIDASVLALAALGICLLPGFASAHGQVGTLGSSATATDLYAVTCFTEANLETHHLLAQIKDDLPKRAPKVSLQIIRTDLATPVAASTTDNTDGDDNYSPDVQAAGGNGRYFVIVNKTAAGAENYTIQFHCQTADLKHTGTLVQTKQDQ
ncbi:MAG: hypothetical protein U1E83_10645 [Methylotetracoccus sp.]